MTTNTTASAAQDKNATDDGKVVDMGDFVQSRQAKVAAIDTFSRSLNQFKHWREDLAQAIADYQAWVERQGFSDGEQDLRVYELIEMLHSDKLTVAMVAEYSRGKTELLNAIFFSDYKQRLLPSAAGRTTMCPTELRWDEKDGPCIKLLPIETRKTASSISEYKRTPVHWTTIHILKLSSAEEVREALSEITKTKKVNIREAQELGLYDPTQPASKSASNSGNLIEVPVWRHAIVNFPSPLLKQGLVVLDTPGLNALGVEPELTFTTLPNVQAILFVLAADAGVTKTDLDVWKSHVNNVRGNPHLVALNKIDILWDELHDDTVVKKTIARQIDETARALNIDRKLVFPVSAQKGLVAKIKGDPALIARSGLAALEDKLTQDMIPTRHMLIRNRIVHEISGRVESSRALIESKLLGVNKQLAELKTLNGKNREVILKMIVRMRLEKQKYDKELEGFQLTRAALSKQAQILLGHLSMTSLDDLIKQTRISMNESWTTRGLKNGMSTLFAGTRERMEKVNFESDEIRKVVEAIYLRLHTEYGLAKIVPPRLSLLPFVLEFKKLEERADVFRNSPVTVMTEQHFVIKKFFITLVSQVRQLFTECNTASKNWFQAAVTPVFAQVQQHKSTIDRSFEALKKIHENMDTLGERIADLEETRKDLINQMKASDTLLERIHRPFAE
ncbi:MAG: dynamin family protein [Gammaproteobacteria bacterium]|nr:dynamin family protein [Gammaproteobacteria bacterium]MDH3562412.1 dynamin family protein [Gammaproteobacteria bacterium]MDH5486943.1 dynamin family protein [Gammaproteobacteria bacterium]